MGNIVKSIIGEKNGVNILEHEEYQLLFDDLPEIDVSTTPPETNNILGYDGDKWVPTAIGPGLEFAYAIQMGNTGNTGVGKWLDYHHNISSNDVPFSIPKAVTLKVISVNIQNSSTVTFTVFKNGSPLETLTVTSSTTNKKIGLDWGLVVGDFINVKVTSGVCASPVFHLLFG